MPGQNDQLLNANNTCGQYVYTDVENKVQFIITGDPACSLYVQVTNSIYCSAKYQIDVEDFFDEGGPTQFIDRVAAVLNIPIDTIRIVSVVKGSTIINFFVDSSYQNNSNPSLYQSAITEL